MESQKVWVSYEDLVKVKREMALFRETISHLKNVLSDLKRTVSAQMQEKTRNSTSMSTDSGMSSETPPNQHAENGVDSKMATEEIEMDAAVQALLSLQTSTPIRPVQPLRYGIIRHNPTRDPRTSIKQEPMSPDPMDDVDEIQAAPETYLHKKKRAVKMLERHSISTDNMVKPRFYRHAFNLFVFADLGEDWEPIDTIWSKNQ